ALDAPSPSVETPQSQQRARAGAEKRRRERSPTPDGILPPHERYFFQNRPGPPQTSANTLRGLSLLTHDEYFQLKRSRTDPNVAGKVFLAELHQRAFAQWEFELSQGFTVCLYGFGSKRQLAASFAEWLHARSIELAHKPEPESGDEARPTIVVANGYVSGTTARGLLLTVLEAIHGREEMPRKVGAQAFEVLDLVRAGMRQRMLASSSSLAAPSPITVIVNSIDAAPMRRPGVQSMLARLACVPGIRVLATADTLQFPVLWDMTLREQFRFVFHDCTTFESFSAEELSVVDEVHALLGRRTRRIGGKDGIGFVLKSLPENTRKLYRLILTEVLSGSATRSDTGDLQASLSDDDDNDNDDEGRRGSGAAGAARKDDERLCVPWRTVYNKATEEFICSSEMMFRTQLKEFYDHHMVVSRTDASGLEMLGVTLSREEMTAVLDET
ncbi:Origin recognition complex subunit 2, partial [Ascosphaera acerosa]